MTDTQHEYIKRAKAGLDSLDAKLGMLEAKASEKKGDARQEIDNTLTKLRDSRKQAGRRLEELRQANQPAWEDMKQGVERAWTSLSTAVNDAAQRYQ